MSDQEGIERGGISDGSRRSEYLCFCASPNIATGCECWCGLVSFAGSTVGGRMGQKQTLAPMIDSGSCDRQSWRIIKMKLPTGQTALPRSLRRRVLCCIILVDKDVGLCGRGRIVLGGLVLRQRWLPPPSLTDDSCLNCNITPARFRLHGTTSAKHILGLVIGAVCTPRTGNILYIYVHACAGSVLPDSMRYLT